VVADVLNMDKGTVRKLMTKKFEYEKICPNMVLKDFNEEQKL
jgi:hypothetical protein